AIFSTSLAALRRTIVRLTFMCSYTCQYVISKNI
ncbi:hypothetical protein GWI33_003260, partial [Rhynchophorus ferrugineus]